MMMGAYRAQKCFKTETEEGFLTILAKQMNTSIEQLRSTYVGMDSEDFTCTTRKLVAAMSASVEEIPITNTAEGSEDAESRNMSAVEAFFD